MALRSRLTSWPRVPGRVERRLPPRGRGWLRRGRMALWIVVDELFWLWWQLRSLTPAATRRHAAALADGDPALPTVVPLAGLMTKWDFLLPLLRHLHAAGFRVAAPVGMGRNLLSPKEYSERVTRWVRTHPELGRVVFVGHSKGGLVGKLTLLRMRADAQLRGRAIGVVAISTPFSGATRAKLIPAGLSRSDVLREARALRVGSPELVELADARDADAQLVSLSALYDEVVGVPGRVEGGVSLRVGELGHNRLLATARVQRVVEREIRRLTALAEGASARARAGAGTAGADADADPDPDPDGDAVQTATGAPDPAALTPPPRSSATVPTQV